MIWRKNCILDDDIDTNDILIYKDDRFMLSISPQEQERIFVYSENGKTIVIGGNIRVLESYCNQNPAEIYAKKYHYKQNLFLLNCEGDFIITEHDKFSKSASVFRDLQGIKHVYYTTTNYGVCISTSINDILKFKGRGQTSISKYSLSLYLTLQYVPQPYTLFDDVYQLPINGIMKI
jgi:asparagine synthetase B (glutamine-hydrolysing)